MRKVIAISIEAAAVTMADDLAKDRNCSRSRLIENLVIDAAKAEIAKNAKQALKQ